MNRHRWIPFCVATLLFNAAALACPLCKVAGDDLGTTDFIKGAEMVGDAASQPADKPTGPRIGLAMDFASANYHHGYMLQDRGLVMKPSISISTQPIASGDWTIEPYFVWMNTFHTHQSPGYAGGHGSHTKTEQKYEQYLDEPHDGAPFPHFHSRLVDVISYENAGGGWFESEVKPGIRFSRGPLAIDLAISAQFYPSDFHDLVIDASAKVTYDLATLWSDEEHPTFGLRGIAAVTQELKDDNGAEDTVFELGLEPIYRFTFKDKRASVSMPIALGMSPNGYYQKSSLDDAFFGYTSIGVELSLPLPVNEKYGRWFFNAGVTGYQMLADSAEFANDGKQGVSTHIGLGIAF